MYFILVVISLTCLTNEIPRFNDSWINFDLSTLWEKKSVDFQSSKSIFVENEDICFGGQIQP